MSYDNSYYVGHLQPLLTDEELYNVDPYLFSLRERTAVNTAINSEKYFKTITNTGVRFISDNKAEVISRAAMDVNTFNMTNAQSVRENVTVGTFIPLTGAATEEFARVELTYGSTNIDASKYLTEIKKSVSDTNVEKEHQRMHNFLRGIVLTVGVNKFIEVIDNISMANSRGANFFDESKYLLKALNINFVPALIYTVSDTAKSVLCTMVKTKIQQNLDFNNKSTTTQEQRKYILTNLMEDLQIDKFKGPLYYNLRTELTNQIKFPANTFNHENKNVQLYLKQLVADIYIKTCYPVIIFDYIDCMMNLYIEYGDFVNSRIALLAKVMFGYYIFVNISTAYSQMGQAINDPADPNRATIENYISKINFYLQNINNIDLNASNNNMMKSIVKDLHKKSAVVVDKSKEIQMLKEQIKGNQLAYRNVIYNTDVSKKFYKAKITENIVLIVILLLLIVVCSVLLFLHTEDNKLNLYVTYISGGFALIILMYLIFKMVSKLVRK